MMPRTTLRLLTALALVLGLAAAPAAAQPAPPDEAEVLADLERTLHDPAHRATLSDAEWVAYGDVLEGALASDNRGVREGAVRMIIFYGEALGIDRRGAYQLTRIYREDADDRLRRMAVVALGQTGNGWGLDLLRRSVRYERTPEVRQTILAVLAAHATPDLGPAKVGGNQ